MTDMNNKSVHHMIALISCYLNQRTPSQEVLNDLDMESLYKTAKRHNLTALVAAELEKLGIQDHQFSEAKAKAIRKAILFHSEREKICTSLEKSGIWYMPLKGSVIQNIYPRLGLRQMADNDILFDISRAEDVKHIFEGFGYSTIYFELGNHDVYRKEPVLNFEMHRALFGPSHERLLYEYYKDVKKRLLLVEGTSFRYQFTTEDFYVYMLAHESKHYNAFGTGLRSLLDIYIYLRKYRDSIDFSYIEGETKKLGIYEFEQKSRSLALNLFDGNKLTEEEKEMLSYMISSGTYGTVENKVANSMRKMNRNGKITFATRIKYYWKRIFMSRKILYPRYKLAKYPILMPLVWAYRIIMALTVRRNKVRWEVKAVNKQRN